MPFVLGLGHFCLLCLERLRLVGNPLMDPLQRLFELLSLALLMPIGANDQFAAIVDLECTMVDHMLEAVFLYLVSLAVHPWPLARLHDLFDLRGPPVHQGLAFDRLNHDKVNILPGMNAGASTY